MDYLNGPNNYYTVGQAKKLLYNFISIVKFDTSKI